MNESKNTLVVVAIVVLLAIGGFFLIRQNSKDTSQEAATAESQPSMEEEESVDENQMEQESMMEEAKEVVTVTYSDAGFSPDTVTVEVGKIVKWVNESTGGMWVASAPHPAHDVYPEFDQTVSIEAGSEYMFTFDKEGEWMYHNHVAPSSTGKVVVTAAMEASSEEGAMDSTDDAMENTTEENGTMDSEQTAQ